MKASGEAVRACRRSAGHTQQQLARAIGLHPDVLGHKRRGRDGAVLTTADVTSMVNTLEGWGAIASRAEGEALLALMAVPPHVMSAQRGAAGAAGRSPDGRSRRRIPLIWCRPGWLGPDGPARRPRLVPVRLPKPLTPLVGRTIEVAAVMAVVAASRLVTLTGVGEPGRPEWACRRAGELAGSFADGVAFADLAPVSDPAAVAVAVALTLTRALVWPRRPRSPPRTSFWPAVIGFDATASNESVMHGKEKVYGSIP